MKLPFKSINFQNMAKFFNIKNIKGLKQYCVLKKQFSVKTVEKIKNTRKIFVEQVKICEYFTKKQ